MKAWADKHWLVVIFLSTVSCPLPGQRAPSDLPRVTLPDAPALIYSTRADDPWNRIFFFLFSRRLDVRLSADFPQGAPFDRRGDIPMSQDVFERNETGDHAIDPMYPTFSVGFGSMLVLRDPAYAKLTDALRSALDADYPRPAVARAMMQSDLWGAYDELSVGFLPDDEKALGERRKVVQDLIGRLIRKIALTQAEIRTLPENYSAVVSQQSFPDVFGKNSGWVEVAWFLPREHDDSAGYRRVSRVFVKPAHRQRNLKTFLNSLPDDPTNETALEGVALITQLLLVDSLGNPQPTKLTVESQARVFDRSNVGKTRASLKVSEISRKLLLENPSSGGLVTEGEETPAYLSNGGSYGFAEGFQRGEPVQVHLRTRCARCHDDDLALVRTFAISRPPHANGPPVRQLDSAGTKTADFDIAEKRKQESFRSLTGYFR